MRSHFKLKLVCALLGAGVLVGCLHSEEPLFDKNSARAKPIKPGSYTACPLIDETKADEDDGDECQLMTVSVDKDRGTIFYNSEEDEETPMRLRRVAFGSYAVQLQESDDSYQYYFGKKAGRDFHLTMMLCESLPSALRDDLVARGALQPDSERFENCSVTAPRAVIEAAKAYHRGTINSDDEQLTMVISPLVPSSP